LFSALEENCAMTLSACGKALVKVALIGTLLIPAAPIAGPAIGSAQAKEFYTRKRVNGVWIKGHFKRKQPARQAVAQKGDRADKAVQAERAKVAYLDPRVDRAPPFQRAAEARALAAATLYVEDGSLVPLRRALEAKAKAMSAAAMPAAPRTVKTVTFDFATGLRTSIYDDGSVQEEPFDLTTGSISPVTGVAAAQP
jgi:hypothetical protein